MKHFAGISEELIYGFERIIHSISYPVSDGAVFNQLT